MKRSLLSLFTVLCLLMPFHTAQAQLAGAIGANQEEQSADTVSKESLQRLVKTLENPQEREKFLENLNALIKSDIQLENADTKSAEQEEGPLSEVLGLEDQTEQLASDFDTFLEEKGLNASYVGKSLSTFGIFFICWIFCFLALKASRML